MDPVIEFKLQTLDEKSQELLKAALVDPRSVDLEKASNVIVDQALKDGSFCKEAGRIIFTLIKEESIFSNTTVFRRNLLNRMQREFLAREEKRKSSLSQWICLVNFICTVFDYLKVNDEPMAALVHPVYDCLFRLAQPDALTNEEEVDCLAMQLHRVGQQLERMEAGRMDDLFCALRDGFLLQAGLSSMTRLLLLEVLEFRAGGWLLSDCAHNYYYSEVAN
ncbi:MIF4G domain-containing protein A [Engraulis encrasicolus]|uniref:MIF4G domain-containing protein A n=1 Tax=Engraulis encrasicolus TaxID=184585 RepID=UPI002FCECB95